MNIFTALLEFFQEASKESFLQFWNAYWLIVETPSGIVALVSPLQPENA